MSSDTDFIDELISLPQRSAGFDTELILQTAPTRTLVSSGAVLKHGILVPHEGLQRQRHLLRIGVPNVGWFGVKEGIGADSLAKSAPVATDARERQVQSALWLLERQDTMYFPITERELLPRHLQLSVYDTGHQVIGIRGEPMGRTGEVVGASFDNWFGGKGEWTLRVRWRDGNVVTIKQDSIAVLWPEGVSPEQLTSTGIQYPPGSQVWAKVPTRAGRPYQWERAVVVGMENGQLAVALIEDGGRMLLGRDAVWAGDEEPPAIREVTPTSKGYNPVPRGKRAKRWQGVPPAKS